MLTLIFVSLLILVILSLSFMLLVYFFRYSLSSKIKNILLHFQNSINLIDSSKDLYVFLLDKITSVIGKKCKGYLLIYDSYYDFFEYVSVKGHKYANLTDTTIYQNEFNLLKKDIMQDSNFYLFEFNFNNSLWGCLVLDLQDNYINLKRLTPIYTILKSELEFLISSINILFTLKENSSKDYLTGIMNRRYFEKKFKSLQQETKCILALIDLNNFKLINDTHGHLQGDYILKKFTDVVSCYIRCDDYFARIGGDEFVILFKNTSFENVEQKMAILKDKLIDIIRFSYGLEEVVICENCCLEKIIQIVDAKMYSNKKALEK